MVGLLIVLAVLLSLVSFAATIWLAVVAFRKSVLWGLGTLFVPFCSLVFAALHWQEAKKPFLVGMASGFASILFFFGAGFVGATSVAREMQASARDGAPPRRPGAVETASIPRLDDDSSSEGDAPEPSAPLRVIDDVEPPTPPTPAGAKSGVFDLSAMTRDGFAPVALADAAPLKGRWARVLTRDGKVHRGEIVAADASGVRLEHYVGSGTMVVGYRRGEIDKLLVEVSQ